MSQQPKAIKLSRNALLLFAGCGVAVAALSFYNNSVYSTIFNSLVALFFVVLSGINKSAKTYQLVVAIIEILIAGLLLILSITLLVYLH